MRCSAAFAGLLLVGYAAAAVEPWAPFIGSYAGEAISDTGGALEKRDLEVEIQPHDRGFRLTWVASTQRPEGRIKRKEYRIDFEPSRRDGVFVSAMRSDLFGNRQPLDPMRGEPYVWARIVGDTLSVFSMLITDTGSYEMQVYHRTLTDNGLAVSYTRFAEGEVRRTVVGSLHRR